MVRLEILKGTERTPNLNNTTLSIIPDVRETQKLIRALAMVISLKPSQFQTNITIELLLKVLFLFLETILLNLLRPLLV